MRTLKRDGASRVEDRNVAHREGSPLAGQLVCGEAARFALPSSSPLHQHPPVPPLPCAPTPPLYERPSEALSPKTRRPDFAPPQWRRAQMRLYWPEVPPNPPGPMRAHGGASSPAADAQSAWSRFEVREVSRLADAIITAMRQQSAEHQRPNSRRSAGR